MTPAQRGVIMSGDVAGLAELVARAEQTLGKIRDAEKGLWIWQNATRLRPVLNVKARQGSLCPHSFIE